MVLAALCDVHFQICAGQTLALVGASGSGKSTAARCIARLEQPDSGQIWMDGTDLLQLDSRALFPVRSKIQMIFQDAVTSMNPRFSAAQVIEEPLRIRNASRSERRDITAAVMQEVGLTAEWLNRSIHQFKGMSSLHTWLARIMVNAFLNQKRKSDPLAWSERRTTTEELFEVTLSVSRPMHGSERRVHAGLLAQQILSSLARLLRQACRTRQHCPAAHIHRQEADPFFRH